MFSVCGAMCAYLSPFLVPLQVTAPTRTFDGWMELAVSNSGLASRVARFDRTRTVTEMKIYVKMDLGVVVSMHIYGRMAQRSIYTTQEDR